MYDVSGIEALADALVFNGSLNSLDLSRNNIGPEGAEALTVALTPNAAGLCNRSLDTLDVRGNAITGEAAEQLAKAVLEHPSMKVFNTIAMQDVKNDQLTQLDLRKADVGIPGVVVLSKLLVFNGSLNTVNLSYNFIGDEGAKALAVALTPNMEGVFNRFLNTLDISGNNIGPDGAKALAVALTPNEDGVFNESLNTLNLDRNQLCGVDGDGDGTSDASGIKALANALASNKSLNTLNLADNNIGPDEAKALALALTPNQEGVFNTSLNTLILSGNEIGPEGAKALAAALTPNEKGMFNTSLNTLNLKYNDVGDEGEAAVQEVVKKHPNVATFNLKI
ncbi:hypothetical protein CYMTET_24681 [Cymbomonas tetramitiformis]|uniref:Uncharacterized protein n=1 Tax=Cymbomonas tetramitiformis TaxID=36881 RepID=A0AAE0FW37_9CHLO|nr:hypothetical protein CYMTET_24681 [Cymbomonas tetramitiformis]